MSDVYLKGSGGEIAGIADIADIAVIESRALVSSGRLAAWGVVR